MYIRPAPLRAFISGPQRDLRPERDAADRVLRRLGFFEVLRAETATSAAASPQSVCEGLASSCDLYVGIFGLSYGSTPPGKSVSVTEMEFDIARAADPAKILAFRKAGTPDQRQQDFLGRVEGFADGYFRAAPFDTPAILGRRLRRATLDWLLKRMSSTRYPLDIVYDELLNKDGPTTDDHFPEHTWRLFRVKVVNRGPETLEDVTVRLTGLSPRSNVSIGSPFCVTDDGAEPISLHPGGMQPIDIVFALLTGPNQGHLYFHLPKSADRRLLPGGRYRGTLVATGRNVKPCTRRFTLIFEGGTPPAFKLGGSGSRQGGGTRR